MQIIVCIAIAIYVLLLGFVLGALFAVKCLAKKEVATQPASREATKDNTNQFKSRGGYNNDLPI